MRMPDYQVTGEGRTTIFLLHGIYGAKDYPWAENPAEFNPVFFGFLQRNFG
jgi:hypothetical protein